TKPRHYFFSFIAAIKVFLFPASSSTGFSDPLAENVTVPDTAPKKSDRNRWLRLMLKSADSKIGSGSVCEHGTESSAESPVPSDLTVTALSRKWTFTPQPLLSRGSMIGSTVRRADLNSSVDTSKTYANSL